MPRKTLYVSDELAAAIDAAGLELNWSEILQEGLRARLGCDHHQLACSHCAQLVSRLEVTRAAKRDLFLDVMDRLTELVHQVGTAEGAARVTIDVATRHQVPGAATYPTPRPSRGERARARVVDLADEAAGSRRRHPTSRPATATTGTPSPVPVVATPTTTRRTA